VFLSKSKFEDFDFDLTSLSGDTFDLMQKYLYITMIFQEN